MVKRLLTFCAVALMAIAVMASPEQMQKKNGKHAAVNFTPVAFSMPTSTRVAAPANTKRTTERVLKSAPAAAPRLAQKFEAKYDSVALPFSIEGAQNTEFQASVSTERPVHVYKFTLNESAKVVSNYSGTNLYQAYLLDADSNLIASNDLVSLPAGSYYACVFGMNTSAEYNLSIRTVSADFDYSIGVRYYDTDFSDTLAVGEVATGKLNYYTSTYVYDPEDGNTAGYSVNLHKGLYKVKATVQTIEPTSNCKVAVFTCDAWSYNYKSDTLAYGSNFVDKSSATTEVYFRVSKDSTYRFYVMSSDFDSYEINYSVVVEEVFPEPYVKREVPFTVSGDMNTGAITQYGATFNAFIAFYLPQDTLIEIHAQVDNINFDHCALSISKKDASPIGAFDENYMSIWNKGEFVDYIKLPKGNHYLSLLATGLEGDMNYKIQVKYCDKKLVTDTITIEKLLENAPEATLGGSHELFMGAEPTRLVMGEDDYFREIDNAFYAIAYKLNVDSGARIAFAQTTLYDEYLYIYQQQADTLARVYDSDDSNGMYIADSTTTYYVVLTAYDDANYDYGNLTYTLNVLDAEPVKIEDLLAAVTQETKELKENSLTLDDKSATLVLGENFRFRDNGYDAYAVAYKLNVDSGNMLHVTYTSDDVDNFLHIYRQVGDTIVMVFDEDDADDTHFEVDSTTTYYVVFTTYYAAEVGKITISYVVEQPSTLAEILAAALPLTEPRGTVTLGESFYYNGRYITACKADMDSAQLFNTVNSIYDGYRIQADTIASYHRRINGYICADSTATYYFLFASFDKPVTSLTYELSVKMEDLVNDAPLVVDLPIIINDTLARFVTPWATSSLDSQFYTDHHYDIALNKGDRVGMFYSSASANMSSVLLDKTSELTVLSGSGASQIFASDKVSNTGLYHVYVSDAKATTDVMDVKVILNYIYPSLDSLMHFAMDNLPAGTMPFICKGAISDWTTQYWYNNGGYITAAQLSKVALKANDKINVNGKTNMKSRAYIYRDSVATDGTHHYLMLANRSGNYAFTQDIPVDGNYVIVFATFESLDGSYWSNTTYELSAINLSTPSKVVNVEADCKYIEVADLNEVSIKAALTDLTLYAVTENGTQVEVANKITHWIISADSTQAQYKVQLDEGFAYAENADSIVTVLINPVKVIAIAGENGAISPAGEQYVRLNGSITFTITADKGYVISQILVNGEAKSADCLNKGEGEYTVEATADATIEVEFKQASAINATELTNVVVYGRDRMIVVDGADANSDVRIFTITGCIIYAGRTTSTYEQYAVPTSGLYIIRIADKVSKVIVK